MKINREKINIEPEQDLLIGLIMSDRFIREIYSILDISLLEVQYVRQVAQWCVEYYETYEQAPKQTIQDIYNSKRREGIISDNTVEFVEKFLVVLSKRFENNNRFNEQYILDQSERYLAKRKLISLQENITACLMKGELDKAESLVAKHMRVERPSSTSTDIFDMKNLFNDLLYGDGDVLLRFPGALGQMVGDVCRGDFLSFIGPMKRGKSFWLVDAAIRCLMEELHVLYVSLEMPRKAVRRRIFSNFFGEPRNSDTVNISFFDEDNFIREKKVEKKGYVNLDVAKKVEALKLLFGQDRFRLVCYPIRSASVSNIKIEMQNLMHYNKFYPDVLLVDHADILAPEPGALKDKRDRIDETWVALRRVAQEINGLVITVSQSGRATFKKDIEEGDVSEDIRKLAHVTHMIAINQNKEEKERGIMRTSLLVGRELEFNPADEVVVLLQRRIGKAYLDSRWKKDVNGESW